jgi:tricorn protease-like protein
MVREWIYYTNFTDHIHRVKTDGSNLTQLPKHMFGADGTISQIAIANNRIYFLRNRSLYSVNLDGNDLKPIYTSPVRQFTTINGKIYFNSFRQEDMNDLNYKSERVYRVNLDGTIVASFLRS